MMTLLPWQQKNWDRLCNYGRHNRVPQALFIIGNKGLGKQHLANQYAYSLLCVKPKSNGIACGRCHSCLLLNAETHPDFIQIQPDEAKTSITIDQIRSLVAKLTLKPQYEMHRVVIINPADKMNNAAANSFLKCLEEPAERTVIILISDRPAQLPATIVSRCQRLLVAKPDKETVSAWLKQQNVKDDPELLFGLAQGSPLQALHYAKENVLALRKDCFKAWVDVAKQRLHPVIVAENWHKFPESLLMLWMTSWVVDLIKCCYQLKADSCYNYDLSVSLQELSGQLELKGLYEFYDLLLKSRQLLDTQINKHLMFEEILIKWFELNLSK
jgi:DNA polymerase-3 subunit delta'